MAIRVTSTHISKIKSSDRFEPRYHLVFNKFNDFEKLSQDTIVDLGDKRLLLKITDGEHAGQVFVKEGVRFIKNSSVKDFNISLLDGFYITEEKHFAQKRSALKAEDILFTTVGHLGATVIVPDDFGEANINQNVVKLEVDANFIDPYYLTVYLNSNVTKKQISALFTGNIHNILTYPKIKSIKVLIPSKDFQNSISNDYKIAIEKERKAFYLIEQAIKFFYEKINVDFDKIENKKHYSVNLSDFKKSDLWIPKYSFPKYVNTLNSIKEKWKTISLGSIATVKKGDEVGSINYNKYLVKKENDVPFIRTSDFVNYEIDQYPDFFIPKEIYNELNQDIKDKDVLFSKDGKVGMTAMITKDDKVIVSSGISRIRINENAKKYHLTNEYLFLLLSLKETGYYPAMRRTVVASTIPHLREDRLKEFEIPILEKKSIEKITNLIEQAFELKNEKKIIIRKLREKVDKYFDQ